VHFALPGGAFFPAAHDMQACAPCAPWYLPVSQKRHDVWAVPGCTFPGRQRLQSPAPWSALYLPSGQSMHGQDATERDWYFPAGHLILLAQGSQFAHGLEA